MNQEEYELRKNNLEKNITQEQVEKSNPSQELTETDIDEMIEYTENISSPEIEEKLESEQQKINERKNSIESAVELDELLDEKNIRLGIQERVPILIDYMGRPVKVFITPITRTELFTYREEAENTGADFDFLLAQKKCTNSKGKPYTTEQLDALGYARVRDIVEAIGILSGENPETTESAIRKQAIDQFLQRFIS